jgi:hypothetical protein
LSWDKAFVVGVPVVLALLAIPVLLGALTGGPAGPGYGYGGGPPTLPADMDLALKNVPVNTTVNATGPNGAVVAYSLPTVVDEDTPKPAVSCVPPSGSTFAIGTTQVTCTVRDADDANSPVVATFGVSVKGAAAQLQDLHESVVNVGPGSSFADQVQSAINAFNAGDTASACSQLSATIHYASAQSGRLLTVAQASSLISSAQRIQAVMGC